MLQFGREKGRAEEPWKNNNQSPPIFDILLPFSCRNGLSLPLNIGSNHFFFSLVFFYWAPFTSCFLRVYLSISIWSFSRVTQEGAKKKSKDENTITTTTRQQNHFEPRFSDPGAAAFLRFFCFSFVFLAFQFPSKSLSSKSLPIIKHTATTERLHTHKTFEFCYGTQGQQLFDYFKTSGSISRGTCQLFFFFISPCVSFVYLFILPRWRRLTPNIALPMGCLSFIVSGIFHALGFRLCVRTW